MKILRKHSGFTISSAFLFSFLFALSFNPFPASGGDTWGDNIISGRLAWQKDSAVIYLKNKGLCDLTVRYWLDEAVNTGADKSYPFTITLKPGEEKDVLKLHRDDPSQDWRFLGNYSWRQGNASAVHDDNVIYKLPYPKGKKYRVMQGYDGAYTHKGEYQNSIDWDMPDNSEVCACRGGLVVDVTDNFEGCGMTDYYRNRNNVIRILHSDGTIGEYVHFRKNGARVKTGDKVKAGDLIGISGNVGYSGCYHLHFNVYIPGDGSNVKTIPTVFETKEEGKTGLEEGKVYTGI